MKRNLILTAGLSLILAAGAASDVPAQHEHQHEESKREGKEMMKMPHGGGMAMAEGYHFEVVFNPGEVRLYAFDADMEPVKALKKAQGTLTLSPPEGDAVEIELAYVSPDANAGRTQGYLGADYAFEKADTEGMTASIALSGLAEKKIAFEAPVEVGPLMMFACPMNCVEPVQDPMACPKCGMQMKPMHKMEKGHDKHEDQDHNH